MFSVHERNQEVSRILDEYYGMAIQTEDTDDNSDFRMTLNDLFTTTAWGFREILLVVIIGMKLDSNYYPSKELYACKPRAIYEGPIKDFFLEKNIPHRKSGPLNVAKATVGLDHAWAAQRRPSDVAEKVVELIRYLEFKNRKFPERLDVVGISLVRNLLNESKRLTTYSIEIEPTEDPDFLYTLCHSLITETPDAGNTPQKIAGLLLRNYHRFMNTGFDVTGGDDRASVTSTTSKKPGDINEEKYGRIYKVYEITVKPFDLARIRDSYDCVSIYNQSLDEKDQIKEIVVICRMGDCPSDMKPSGLYGYIGSYSYRSIVYYFWDIFEWIASTLQHMTACARNGFYIQLNDYINETNTAEDVKALWQLLHE